MRTKEVEKAKAGRSIVKSSVSVSANKMSGLYAHYCNKCKVHSHTYTLNTLIPPETSSKRPKHDIFVAEFFLHNPSLDGYINYIGASVPLVSLCSTCQREKV